MKKFVSMALSTLMAVSLVGCSNNAAGSETSSKTSGKTYKIAVVKQLDHASLDEIANAITSEFDAIASKEGITIEYEVFSGENDVSNLKAINDQAVNEGVDAIVPIATLAAQSAVTSASDSQTPVIFAAISDPEGADLTGFDYVTGTSDALNTKQIIDMMLAQNPDLKTVGLLYSTSETNSKKPIAEAKEYLDQLGITYVESTANVNDEVIAAAATLTSQKVDAVFTPTDNVIMAAELAIADTFADAGIPHYTGADSFVRNGAFTTCGVNYTELGKKTAQLAYQAVTVGMNNLDDYYLMDGGIVTVNTETAKKLGADYSVFTKYGELVEVETTED